MDIALHNDHNVYILGAGFSRDAELPLIADFLLRMRDSHEWLMKEQRNREADAVGQVLQFRRDAASAAYWVNLDLENIEELFSLASASKGEMQKHIQLAIAATLDFSRQITSKRKWHLTVRGDSQLFHKDGPHYTAPRWARLAQPPSGSSDGMGPFAMDIYDYFVAHLLGMFQGGEPIGENTFISFNYDTILETALDNLGVEFCYGFRPNSVDPEGGRKRENGVPVLKLHGSVNWARRDGSLRIFPGYDSVLEAGSIPELVPPTWKKVFDEQLQDVWETAVQRIGTATRIIIIGFSMPPTDVHFQYLMAAGLQNNVSLRKILFVNPTPTKELEPRVRRTFRSAYVDTRQIGFRPMTVRQFIGPSEGQSLVEIGRPCEPCLQKIITWSA